jgi:hypothetical protein
LRGTVLALPFVRRSFCFALVAAVFKTLYAFPGSVSGSKSFFRSEWCIGRRVQSRRRHRFPLRSQYPQRPPANSDHRAAFALTKSISAAFAVTMIIGMRAVEGSRLTGGRFPGQLNMELSPQPTQALARVAWHFAHHEYDPHHVPSGEATLHC